MNRDKQEKLAVTLLDNNEFLNLTMHCKKFFSYKNEENSNILSLLFSKALLKSVSAPKADKKNIFDWMTKHIITHNESISRRLPPQICYRSTKDLGSEASELIKVTKTLCEQNLG